MSDWFRDYREETWRHAMGLNDEDECAVAKHERNDALQALAAKDAEIAALRSEWVNAETSFGKERLIYCERIAALREALEWYAEPVLTYAITQDREPRSAVHADGGRRARAALEMSGGVKA